MATATITGLAATLQEFYLDEVNKQLNDGTFLFSEMEKSKSKWNGKHFVVHAWISRNIGIGFSDGQIPDAGTQGTVSLAVTAKRFYGRFSVDGTLIEAAPKGGGHAFIDWANLEMNGLVIDCKVALNKNTVSGGLVKGYLNEHKASNTTNVNIVSATAATGGQAGADEVWEYSGHFEEFDGSITGRVAAITTDATTWVPVNLIRTDTGNPVNYVTGGAVPTKVQVWVVGHDAEAMTLTLRVTSVNGGGAAHGFTTAGIANLADGHAISVEIMPSQPIDSGVAVIGRAYTEAGTSGISAVGNQANGIFSCLSLVSYYGETRHSADATALPIVAADGTAPILRCRVRTMTTSGAHARSAITTGRMERMKGILDVLGAPPVSSIFIHPFFKSTYTALSILVHNVDASKASNLDIGFKKDGFAHGATPMRSDRHIPRGLMIFYCKQSWKTCELGAGKFAQQDGSIFSRVPERDEWEGFWRKYYNVVCIRPNANMVLTGFALN